MLLAKHCNENACKKMVYSEKCRAKCLVAMISRADRRKNASSESIAEYFQNIEKERKNIFESETTIKTLTCAVCFSKISLHRHRHINYNNINFNSSIIIHPYSSWMFLVMSHRRSFHNLHFSKYSKNYALNCKVSGQ
jgi:hypothetical protein